SSRLAAHYLVIAGFGERFNDLSGDSFTVDAESRPLVGNGESPFERGVRGCSQADDLDLPGSAVGQQPFAISASGKAVLQQEFFRQIRRVFPPAIAEHDPDSFFGLRHIVPSALRL